MTFHSFDTWWWPYVFILLAGWVATDFWRFLGVYIGGRIAEDSSAMVLVRTIATALVAAVIAKLILYPTGTLEASPLWLRIGAVAAGAAAFFVSGRRQVLAIVVAIGTLAAGLALLGF